MRLLIIGGTGVLSTAVVAEALRKGVSVTMINRGNRASNIPDNVILIKSDCRDYDTIERHIQSQYYDAVIDFLCYDEAQAKSSIEFYSKYAKQYIFISSAAVIDTRNSGVFNEDSPKVLPLWGYSVQKWKAEEFVRSFARERRLNYTIIRPCVTYDDTRIPYGFSPRYGYHWTFVARAKAGKPILTWNEGKNRCNMMRVEDFAKGVVGLISNEKAYNESFNICGDEAPSFRQVLEAMESCLGFVFPKIDVPVSFMAEALPGRKGELYGRSFDAIHSNSKIKQIVPFFDQSIDLKEGVSKTITAYKSKNYQYGIDWIYDAQCDYIIRKWCKMKGINVSRYNLGFIDYLENATLRDRLLYYSIYWQDSALVKAIKILKRLF